MFDGFDVVALFDWELCGVGPAEEDLMNLLAVDAVLAELFGVPRIDGFASRDETVAIYEQLLGRDLVATNWWHVFAAGEDGRRDPPHPPPDAQVRRDARRRRRRSRQPRPARAPACLETL